MAKLCPTHHCDIEVSDCDYCGGEGYTSHDCGEDTCCCAYPEDNVRCDICRGSGVVNYCPECRDEREVPR